MLKLKVTMDLALDQKVSSHLSFALILILAFLVAWFSVTRGQEILENGKESPAFNVNERIERAGDIVQ